MLTNLPHPDTCSARMGTLEHHGEQVRGKGGIRETGRLAKPYDALMRAKRDTVPDWFFHFRRLAAYICLHDCFYPSLTKMLPTGNMGVATNCYRSVTYYSSTRSATMGCGNLPLRSCAT